MATREKTSPLFLCAEKNFLLSSTADFFCAKMFLCYNLKKSFGGEAVEKFTPTYNLEEFKKSDFEFTKTSLKTSKELGFEESDVRDVVSTMKREHFYKSMTSYANHKIWQDVYHVPYENLVLYVKFTQNVISEFTLLSFKEK